MCMCGYVHVRVCVRVTNRMDPRSLVTRRAAISTEGTLFTWGNGGSGRLGECCESPLPLELTVL